MTLLDDVAERTLRCPIAVWGFGVGSALSGLVRAGHALGRDEYIDAVAALVEPSLNAPVDPTDHLISIEALLALAEARPELSIDGACDRWLRAVLGASRPVPGRPPVHRPDLEPWSSTIWVDCMHTDGPGLAALGRPGAAASSVEEYARVLQRADGLFQHGYDVRTGRGSGVAWGRGQAWALLALVETMRFVTDEGLCERLSRLLEAMAIHEDGGRWHTVVDDSSSPIENSVAAHIAVAVPRAVSYGLISAGTGAMADRAYQTTIQAISDGGLPVSEATPVGDRATYCSRATGVFPWGQGPVLHMLLDRLDVEVIR